MRQRLEQAKEVGDLPADADCAALASYLAVQLHGMAILAANGATSERLQQVAALALQVFPGGSD